MVRNSVAVVAQRKTPAQRARTKRRVVVLVATRKGAWLFHSDAARKNWRADGPHFLGHITNHLVLDRATGAHCWRRRRPGISARPCFVPRISGSVRAHVEDAPR